MEAVRNHRAGSEIAKIAAVAVVAPTRAAARDAARLGSRAARKLAGARLLPMTIEGYLRACAGARAPIPLVLAVPASPGNRTVIFLDAARERLLWSLPAPEVYDAISGLRTDLPPRRRRPGGGRRTPSGRPNAKAKAEEAEASVAPYLLLEGDVTAARATRALASPVRNWVVDHVGSVRIGERILSRLAARGVRWSVLRPVRLLGIVDSNGWRASERARLSRASSAPGR